MKNLTFCAFVAIILLLLFSVYGCGGTRNTGIIKKDSIHIENTHSQGTKIILGNTFVYKPFDSLKPMIIDNVVYKNVIITNDKTKIIDKWKNRNIIKTIVTEKNKQTEKRDSTLLWVLIALIVCFFIFLLIYLPKIKT